MKNFLFLGSALGVLLFAGAANAAVHNYTATLNAEQQTENVTSDATGTATMEYDDEAKTLNGTIEFTGLTPNAGHLHFGACGANGGIALTIPDPTTSPIQFIADGEDLTDEIIEALEAGNLYVNLHTEAYPNGEIRGQIYKEGSGESCPPGSGNPDAGVDGGSSSGGTDEDAGLGGGSSGGTSGGTSGSVAPASTEDDSGCSTTGTGTPGSGVALALGVGLAMAAIARGRRGKKA